mgnify:CR=1 FL=1
MAQIPVSAHIVGKSGPPVRTEQPKQVTPEQLIAAAQADLLSLQAWLATDRNTPMLTEVGQRLIDVGVWLANSRSKA